jgi:hypothetical protein
MKLRNYKNNRGCIVATERSRVTRRTVKVVKHNVQSRTVFTKVFGSLHIEASVRDFMTINKYKSLEGFLLNVKTKDLSSDIIRLKNKLINLLEYELNLDNITSLLSKANADKGIKQQMLNYIDDLYTTESIA